VSPVTLPEWIKDTRNQVALAHALNEAGWFENPREVIDFFEKPWKFDPEWILWESTGKPTADDDEGAWGWFIKKLEQQS